MRDEISVEIFAQIVSIIQEQLGGYYLIEAKDLDEAVGIAARIPSVRWGAIEVRPIIPHDMP